MSDFEEDNWNDQCISDIREFFYNPGITTLTIFFKDDLLKTCLGFPNIPVYELTYFLREPDEIFTIENFHSNILFGTINNQVEGNILALMENIFAPIFFKIDFWPDSILNLKKKYQFILIRKLLVK